MIEDIDREDVFNDYDKVVEEAKKDCANFDMDMFLICYGYYSKYTIVFYHGSKRLSSDMAYGGETNPNNIYSVWLKTDSITWQEFVKNGNNRNN